jgi:hypothetical protein
MWRYKRLSPSGRVALVELALSGFQAIGRESVTIPWRSDLDVSPSSLKARALILNLDSLDRAGRARCVGVHWHTAFAAAQPAKRYDVFILDSARR